MLSTASRSGEGDQNLRMDVRGSHRHYHASVSQIKHFIPSFIHYTYLNRILGTFPNSYAFTKALSEGLINQEMDNLPIILLRPSIGKNLNLYLDR